MSSHNSLGGLFGVGQALTGSNQAQNANNAPAQGYGQQNQAALNAQQAVGLQNAAANYPPLPTYNEHVPESERDYAGFLVDYLVRLYGTMPRSHQLEFCQRCMFL